LHLHARFFPPDRRKLILLRLSLNSALKAQHGIMFGGLPSAAGSLRRGGKKLTARQCAPSEQAESRIIKPHTAETKRFFTVLLRISYGKKRHRVKGRLERP
jgi:hypothetical protein